MSMVGFFLIVSSVVLANLFVGKVLFMYLCVFLHVYMYVYVCGCVCNVTQPKFLV
jgi:hypothetical protein